MKSWPVLCRNCGRIRVIEVAVPGDYFCNTECVREAIENRRIEAARAGREWADGMVRKLYESEAFAKSRVQDQ